MVFFNSCFCFDEAMISDTKHFCQSTHFQVLHYAQNIFFLFLFKKKTFYKDQNTMLHARTIKKRYVASAQRYQRRRMRSKGRKVNVLQSPPRCNTTAQESSRTDKERCSYIHVKLSMYHPANQSGTLVCQENLPLQSHQNKEEGKKQRRIRSRMWFWSNHS